MCPLDKNKFIEITGMEISPIKLKLAWEMLIYYLGYDPIEQERVENIKNMSSKVFFKYEPFKKIEYLKLNGNIIDDKYISYTGTYIDISLVCSLNMHMYLNYPYINNQSQEIEISYIAGFKQEEIPMTFYLACKEFLDIANNQGKELSSYSIDTIKETYIAVDRNKKIRELIGKYKI